MLNNKFYLYIFGCILFALGASLFIKSNLGTDPLDIFAIGLKKTFGLKIGTSQSLFAIICLLFWSSINKWKFPPITTFLTFFICGYLIDLTLFSLENFHFNNWAEMLSGVILCTEGSALIIMSTFGIRAMDLLSICLHEKTKKPFWLYKGMFEILLLLTGYLLGGNVGIGTLFFLIFVGWGIQPTIILNQKIGITNFSIIK
jgi:uncharacterized membrane protein YczE